MQRHSLIHAVIPAKVVAGNSAWTQAACETVRKCKSERALQAGIQCLFTALVFATFLAHDSAADSTLEIAPFSKSAPGGALPEGWQLQTFKKIERHTRYELINDGGAIVVKATSQNSASGLTKPLDLDLKEFPILEWRWKITNVLAKGNPKTKSGDDYPARIYLTFKYDPTRVSAWQRTKYSLAKSLYGSYPPHAGINYIWESKLPVGTVVPNAYTDRLRMIVVESGSAKLNEWQSYRRNVYEDYKRIFNEEPPRISGIAIMTDTDNTGENATAYYGDIVLRATGN